MNYLHYYFNLGSGDVVEITLDKQANAKLVSDTNYAAYRAGRDHEYFGGLAKTSPTTLRAPFAGHWHLVIDLGVCCR